MSGLRQVSSSVTAQATGLQTPAEGGQPPPAPAGLAVPTAQRLLQRLRNDGLPRAAWTIGRTGRAGLLGIGLLLAAVVFLVSTHLKIVGEVEELREGVAAAQRKAQQPAPARAADPLATLRALPERDEMPAILRQLFNRAAQAKLSVDTAKYQISEMKSSGVVRHQITFPVTGPYPVIRAFIDATLASMPAVALSELVLERKAISEGDVEAQMRITIFTRSAP